MMNRRVAPPGEIERLFGLFGVDVAARLSSCATDEERRKAFEAAKLEAKLQHHRLAFTLHPDRGGDGEKLKALNAAWTKLKKVMLLSRADGEELRRKSALNVAEARGFRQTTIIFGAGFGFGGVSSTGTSTGTSSTVGWGPDWVTINGWR